MQIQDSSTLPLSMASFFTLFVCLFSLFILSHSSSDSFVYSSCSQIKYTPSSPYESNLNSLLTSLVNSATYAAYDNYNIMGTSPQDVVYGLYQCRGDSAMPDCATCVAQAVRQFRDLCFQTCGGAVQLQGCFVKYDNSTFIGVEDKTVVMKKCGPSGGDDIDAINRQDAVLASLSGAGGLFRVGGSQDVQGVAQCVGDLSMGQCQECLSEAIERLKAECSGAVYGDMFLSKCYARYSTSGADDYAPQPDHRKQNSRSESEKTFAKSVKKFAKSAKAITITISITVGLSALATTIGFTIVVRKYLENGGKSSQVIKAEVVIQLKGNPSPPKKKKWLLSRLLTLGYTNPSSP